MKNKYEPLRRKEAVDPMTMTAIFDKKDILSACKFYKYYHDNYDLFIKDYPELVKGKMYCWLNSHNFDNEADRDNEFNCFLFDYTFDDVVK